jgi:hypothetical protein
VLLQYAHTTHGAAPTHGIAFVPVKLLLMPTVLTA